jgi:hypothetical protein
MDGFSAVRIGGFRALVDYFTINMTKSNSRYWPVSTHVA